MSIEEKAKAYDEALDRAKKELQTCGSTDCDAARQIFRFFPQLRESEDERIRKGLIEALKTSKTVGELKFVLPEPTREECIAYLERQKEQKPNYCHHEVDETDWTEEYRKAYYDGWNNCNMQHEQLKADQKPAEWSKDEKKLIDDVINSLCCYQNTLSDYQKEIVGEEIRKLKSLKPQPKQEWSEKDERTLIHIQSHLKYLIEHRFKIKDYNTMEDRMILESEIKWLENRFKYLCPVKQEWSEDDKRILYNVIAYVGYAAGERGVKDDDFKEANEWLKNLRSQPHWKKSLATADLENSLCDLQDNYHDGSHEYKILGEAIEFIRCTELRPSWKPNKEQMKALEQAKISAIAGNYITKDGLCSLYEQLKKL